MQEKVSDFAKQSKSACTYSLISIGENRLSMDRCYYGAVTARRVDPSLSQTCCWLFPYQRGSVY